MSAQHSKTEDKSKRRADAFRDAEASLLLEGLDPTRDARYREIKAKLIAGAVSFDDAEAELNAQYGDAIRAGVPHTISA
jgi:hypothetical protein